MTALGADMTAASRADLASETRRAAARLNELTSMPTDQGDIQDSDDHRLVWTLMYLADMLEGRRRN